MGQGACVGNLYLLSWPEQWKLEDSNAKSHLTAVLDNQAQLILIKPLNFKLKPEKNKKTKNKKKLYKAMWIPVCVFSCETNSASFTLSTIICNMERNIKNWKHEQSKRNDHLWNQSSNVGYQCPAFICKVVRTAFKFARKLHHGHQHFLQNQLQSKSKFRLLTAFLRIHVIPHTVGHVIFSSHSYLLFSFAFLKPFISIIPIINTKCNTTIKVIIYDENILKTSKKKKY